MVLSAMAFPWQLGIVSDRVPVAFALKFVLISFYVLKLKTDFLTTYIVNGTHDKVANNLA